MMRKRKRSSERHTSHDTTPELVVLHSQLPTTTPSGPITNQDSTLYTASFHCFLDFVSDAAAWSLCWLAALMLVLSGGHLAWIAISNDKSRLWFFDFAQILIISTGALSVVAFFLQPIAVRRPEGTNFTLGLNVSESLGRRLKRAFSLGAPKTGGLRFLEQMRLPDHVAAQGHAKAFRHVLDRFSTETAAWSKHLANLSIWFGLALFVLGVFDLTSLLAKIVLGVVALWAALVNFSVSRSLQHTLRQLNDEADRLDATQTQSKSE